jgi:hypothetical protein
VPAPSAQPARNSTKLRGEVLDSPLSNANLDFAAPEPGEHVTIAEPRSYRVQMKIDAAEPHIMALELSLDAGRPRRLSLTQSTIALGELLSADADLSPGVHWLFAAPVAASGLVPRVASDGPRVAKARRFFVGKTRDDSASFTGAVWLRKPEGTYNGAKSGESVVFDAFVFSALGNQLDTPCTITLESPAVSGQLQLASPFVLHEVPSGLYQVNVNAMAAASSTTRFTVNRELAGGS